MVSRVFSVSGHCIPTICASSLQPKRRPSISRPSLGASLHCLSLFDHSSCTVADFSRLSAAMPGLDVRGLSRLRPCKRYEHLDHEKNCNDFCFGRVGNDARISSVCRSGCCFQKLHDCSAGSDHNRGTSGWVAGPSIPYQTSLSFRFRFQMEFLAGTSLNSKRFRRSEVDQGI
jgi:hypothetical protein